MATFRILEAGNPYNDFVDASSGDAIAICSTAAGEVLLSLDDVDDTIVPTARLTPAEAEKLASSLMAASLRCRAAKASTGR
jgi:hypothetical protein